MLSVAKSNIFNKRRAFCQNPISPISLRGGRLMDQLSATNNKTKGSVFLSHVALRKFSHISLTENTSDCDLPLLHLHRLSVKFHHFCGGISSWGSFGFLLDACGFPMFTKIFTTHCSYFCHSAGKIHFSFSYFPLRWCCHIGRVSTEWKIVRGGCIYKWFSYAGRLKSNRFEWVLHLFRDNVIDRYLAGFSVLTVSVGDQVEWASLTFLSKRETVVHLEITSFPSTRGNYLRKR